MIRIIGEKINGTRRSVADAVRERDAEAIAALARVQAEAGCDWLDVNAGTDPEREPDDLAWLIAIVQKSVDTPLCVDSANPAALAAALPLAAEPPLVNSITAEPERLDAVLPLVAEHAAGVIALAMDGGGLPSGVEERLAILRRLVAATRAAGVPDERVYLDPLVIAVATDTDSAVVTFEALRRLRAEFPEAHLVSAASNVSFGLPARRLVNRTYLTLAVEAGIDVAILDPLDRELRATLLATELVLGRDRHCLAFTRAYRAGLLSG